MPNSVVDRTTAKDVFRQRVREAGGPTKFAAMFGLSPGTISTACTGNGPEVSSTLLALAGIMEIRTYEVRPWAVKKDKAA